MASQRHHSVARDAGLISLSGGCHCGAVSVEYGTRKLPSAVHPRACDCSFCRMHGAAYASDAMGNLLITCSKSNDLLSYRQGSENARFLACAHCGVLLAVTFTAGAIVYGAVNVRCLGRFAEFAESESSSPQLLSSEDKVSRWSKLWVPNVTFSYSNK